MTPSVFPMDTLRRVALDTIDAMPGQLNSVPVGLERAVLHALVVIPVRVATGHLSVEQGAADLVGIVGWAVSAGAIPPTDVVGVRHCARRFEDLVGRSNEPICYCLITLDGLWRYWDEMDDDEVRETLAVALDHFAHAWMELVACEAMAA